MKLFSIYTDQTAFLKDDWFLITLQDDWEVTIVHLKDAPQGNGDYLSREWYHCIQEKIGLLVQAIQDNWNDIILWADIDIQFFRPCAEIVKHCIRGNDIVFQRWKQHTTEVNSGFMAIRCNSSSLAFFEAVLKTPVEGRPFADQDVINDLLKQGIPPVQWALFPREIYQVKLGEVPWKIGLHHACATPEPYTKNGRKISTMEMKAEQLALIRKIARSSMLAKIIARLACLLKTAIQRMGKTPRISRPFSR